MYAKINNGNVEKYPYTISDLWGDNPNTSFPAQMPDERLQDFNVYRVESVEKPSVGFDKNVTESTPILVDGKWKQVWIVTDASDAEHLDRIRAARAEEYPPMSDYLDGVVKGDQAQIQQYIDACLAVKAKYPKPEITNG